MYSIRPAVPDDASAIAEVNIASWRAAYKDLIPDGVLDELTVPVLSRRWLKEVATPDPPHARLVVVEDERGVTGFARFGPARDPDSIEERTTGELYGFYLHPDVWGRGAARALMDGILAELRDEGLEHVTLNVVAGNERARSFYEHLGWTLDKEAAPWFGARQFRYRKEL
ncbi:MAG TPA: GNAT family N-acetyltransferase [Actinomycetota bacterium]|nr:GNAT family N-acetyltransferase [Actinomycetota bacterium]